MLAPAGRSRPAGPAVAAASLPSVKMTSPAINCCARLEVVARALVDAAENSVTVAAASSRAVRPRRPAACRSAVSRRSPPGIGARGLDDPERRRPGRRRRTPAGRRARPTSASLASRACWSNARSDAVCSLSCCSERMRRNAAAPIAIRADERHTTSRSAREYKTSPEYHKRASHDLSDPYATDRILTAPARRVRRRSDAPLPAAHRRAARAPPRDAGALQRRRASRLSCRDRRASAPATGRSAPFPRICRIAASRSPARSIAR